MTTQILFQRVEKIQLDETAFLKLCWIAKTAQENISTKSSEANNPTDWKLDARMNSLIIGPIVCPMSIVVSKNPMDVPKVFGWHELGD